jgi:hypothetical protein
VNAGPGDMLGGRHDWPCCCVYCLMDGQQGRPA